MNTSTKIIKGMVSINVPELSMRIYANSKREALNAKAKALKDATDALHTRSVCGEFNNTLPVTRNRKMVSDESLGIVKNVTRYHNWLVVGDSFRRQTTSGMKRFIRVRCICGFEGDRNVSQLRAGTTRQCKGCQAKAASIANRKAL